MVSTLRIIWGPFENLIKKQAYCPFSLSNEFHYFIIFCLSFWTRQNRNFGSGCR